MFSATQPLERKEDRKEEQRFILTWGANPVRQCLSDAARMDTFRPQQVRKVPSRAS